MTQRTKHLSVSIALMMALQFVAAMTFASDFSISNTSEPSSEVQWDYGRGYGVSCSARDTGWEEHWGGHGSCGACLQKHGECVEVCEAKRYECTAVGQDRQGRTDRIVGRGEDRWRAEDDALYRCQYRLSNCRVDNCSERSQEVSRRSCR